MFARFYFSLFLLSPAGFGDELLQASSGPCLSSTFSASTCFLLLGPKGPADPSAECVTADKVLHTEENLPARQICEWGERSRRTEWGVGGGGSERYVELLGEVPLTGRVMCNQPRRQRRDDQRRSEAGTFSPRRQEIGRDEAEVGGAFSTAVTFIFQLSKLSSVRLQHLCNVKALVFSWR